MRLRKTKAEMEELGEDTTGAANGVSELRLQLKGLTGVDIQDATGAYKSTYEILLEMSSVWSKLTDTQRAAALQLMGGVRQANTLTAIITNMGDAQNALATSLNSDGSAMKENQKYLDSIQGKLDQLEASAQTFSINLLNSEVVKFFVDVARGALDFATALQKINVLIPSIVAGLATIKNKGLFTVSPTSDGNVGLGFGGTSFENLIKMSTATGSSNKFQQIWSGYKNNSSGVVNIDILKKYNKLLDEHVNAYEAAKQACGDYTGSEIYANKVTRQYIDGAGGKQVENLDEIEAANKTATTSTIGLTAAQIALNAALSIGISLLISLAIKGIQYVINYTDNLREKLADIKDELESNNSDIESLSDELSGVIQRLKELEMLGPLTLTQSEEKKNLEDQNIELSRQIALLKIRNEELEKENKKESDKLWNSFTGNSIFSQRFAGSNGRAVSGEESMNYSLNEYKRISEEIAIVQQQMATLAPNGNISESDMAAYTKLDDKLQRLNKQLETSKTNLSTILDVLNAIGNESANQLINRILYIMGDSGTKSAAFNSAVSGVEATTGKTIEEMMGDSEITAENLSDVLGEDVANALIAVAGSAEQVAIELNAIDKTSGNLSDTMDSMFQAGVDSYDSISKKIKILEEAQSEWNQSGILSVDTVQNLIDSDLMGYMDTSTGSIEFNTQALYNEADAAKLAAIQQLANATAQKITALSAMSAEEASAAVAASISAAGNAAERAAGQFIIGAGGMVILKDASGETFTGDKKLLYDQYIADFNQMATTLYNLGSAASSASGGVSDLDNALNDALEAEADAAIQAIDNKIDKLKDELDLLEDQYDQEDKLLELEKARIRLENAQKNKSARIYTSDKGWTWTYDPDELADAKDEYDGLVKEMERDAAKKAIQDQIDALDGLKDKWQEAKDNIGKSLEEHQAELAAVADFEALTLDQMAAKAEDYAARVVAAMSAANSAKSGTTGSTGTYSSSSTRGNEVIVVATGSNNRGSSLYNPNATEQNIIRKKATVTLNSAPIHGSGSTGVLGSHVGVVDDLGTELLVRSPGAGRYTYLEAGDGVVPANITSRLMALGSNPAAYIITALRTMLTGVSAKSGAVGGNETITISNLSLPGVSNGNQFISELNRAVNARRNK